MARCRIWGHRGSPRLAPENTLASFERALRDGAQGIEFDVQCSADGVPVVLHDDTLERTTDGHGPARASTATQICALDAGSWFGPRFRHERVPRLDQVLEWVAAWETEAVLEIKDGRHGVVGACVAAVERLSLLPRVWFHSFAAADLRLVRSLCPRARIQLIGDLSPTLIDEALALRADACSPYDERLRAELIPTAWVEKARAAGMDLNAGLVNDPAVFAALARLGIGAVITDVPHFLDPRPGP